MKLTLGKRILMIVHSILSLLLCIALALSLILPGFTSGILSGLKSSMGDIVFRVVGVALVAIYAIVSFAVLTTAFNRGKKRGNRGFIDVDSVGSGQVRIAVSAVEQMVRQSVRDIDGIDEMRINIDGKGDSIAITVDAVVMSGSHVPTLTSYMQRSIRQFVESNCGVAVSGVMISIDAVSEPPKGARRGIGSRKKADNAFSPAASVPQTPLPKSDFPGEDSAGEADPDGIRPFESEFVKDYKVMTDREATDQKAPNPPETGDEE